MASVAEWSVSCRCRHKSASSLSRDSWPALCAADRFRRHTVDLKSIRDVQRRTNGGQRSSTVAGSRLCPLSDEWHRAALHVTWSYAIRLMIARGLHDRRASSPINTWRYQIEQCRWELPLLATCAAMIIERNGRVIDSVRIMTLRLHYIRLQQEAHTNLKEISRRLDWNAVLRTQHNSWY